MNIDLSDEEPRVRDGEEQKHFAARSISAKGEVQRPVTLIERLEAADHGIRALELGALPAKARCTAGLTQAPFRLTAIEEWSSSSIL